MSHEGIRFTSEEEALRAERAQAPLPKEATTPAKVRVMITEGVGMKIDWTDGHKSAWNFAFLRFACPCATCDAERKADGRQIGEPKKKPAQLLPLYEPPSKPSKAEGVGRYAIKFEWLDGHKDGIYAWDYLRRICQCPICQRDRALADAPAESAE